MERLFSEKDNFTFRLIHTVNGLKINTLSKFDIK